MNRKSNETQTYCIESEIFLSVDETASMLNVDRKTVLQLFHSGELPGKRLGKKIIRFRKDLVLSSFEADGSDSHSSGGTG